MKEQIEEMAKDVAMSISWCDEEILTIDCLETATLLYDKGYRKQSVGEWIKHTASYECTACKEEFFVE